MNIVELTSHEMSFAVRWNRNVEATRVCLERLLKQRSFVRGLAERLATSPRTETTTMAMIAQARQIERAAYDLEGLDAWRERLALVRGQLEEERRQLQQSRKWREAGHG